MNFREGVQPAAKPIGRQARSGESSLHSGYTMLLVNECGDAPHDTCQC